MYVRKSPAFENDCVGMLFFKMLKVPNFLIHSSEFCLEMWIFRDPCLLFLDEVDVAVSEDCVTERKNVRM
jgi:hypothetical protein